MTLLPLVLSIAAFLLFGLATDAHHRRRFGRPLDPRRCKAMRGAAGAALAAGFVIAIAAKGSVFGPILWAGTIMAGAALAFLALNLCPTPVKGPR